MFTTIMYGFINEVTRQPGSANIPLRANRPRKQRMSGAPSQHRIRTATRREVPLSGRYQVLADSFKRAAGFY